MLCSMWVPSFPTRIKPAPPTVEAWILNQQTTREVPKLSLYQASDPSLSGPRSVGIHSTDTQPGDWIFKPMLSGNIHHYPGHWSALRTGHLTWHCFGLGLFSLQSFK